MGDFNQSVILESIRRAPEGLSRTELAEATGLSAQTITNITRRLLDDALVEVAGRTITGPGKPRTTLRLNARRRLSVGVHLDPAVTTFVLLDLTGAVIADSSARTPSVDADHVIASMAQGIDELIDASGVDRGLIAGIGVAAPGPLDAARGTVIDPPKLHSWHTVPLRDELARVTGMHVVLEKDTTAAAVAELWTGDHPSASSFLFVYLGTGIGTALVRDGEVVRGASGNVGEVGHIIVDPDGPQCECGRRGCVEVVCTPQAIVARAARAGVLADAGDGGVVMLDQRYSELCARAAAGGADEIAILEQGARDLSTMISVLTNMLDVDRVVLGGPFWARAAGVHLRVLPEMLDQQSATRAVRRLPVSATIVGDDVGAVGAGCVVLDDVLAPRASALFLDS